MGSYFVQHPDGYDVEFDDSVSNTDAIKAMAKGASVGFSDIPPQEGTTKTGLLPLIQGIVKGDIAASDIGKGLVEGLKDLIKTAPDKVDKAVKGDETAAMQLMTDLFAGSRFGAAPEGMALGSFVGARGMSKVPLLKGRLEQARLRLPELTIEFAKDKKAFTEKYGAKSPMEAVWKETNMIRGPEGGWRYELDDSKIKWGQLDESKFVKTKYKGKDVLHQQVNLSDLMDHPDLFKLYPDMQTQKVDVFRMNDSKDVPFYGQYDPGNKNYPYTLIQAPGRTTEQMNSSLLHEVQHRIQHVEGHSFGSDTSLKEAMGVKKDFEDQLQFLEESKKVPGADRKAIAEQMDNLRQQLIDLREYYPTQVYLRQYGELEARLTQARQKMTRAERKKSYPVKDARTQLDAELMVNEMTRRGLSYEDMRNPAIRQGIADEVRGLPYIHTPIAPAKVPARDGDVINGGDFYRKGQQKRKEKILEARKQQELMGQQLLSKLQGKVTLSKRGKELLDASDPGSVDYRNLLWQMQGDKLTGLQFAGKNTDNMYLWFEKLGGPIHVNKQDFEILKDN